MSRSKEQRELDRQAILDALRDYGSSMTTKQLIGAAHGVTGREIDRIYTQVYPDIAWLQKAGCLTSEYGIGGGVTRWTLVAEFDPEEELDRRDVERMMANWEPA